MADVKILIQHGSNIMYPVVTEGTKLTWERKGTPGKLTFTLVKDKNINYQEGDPVKVLVDDEPVFYGFVFKKTRNKDGTISNTVYDQLRYLKNKDTFTDEGLSASDLLKRLAADFQLNLGTVEDTGYTFETIVQENKTLFDMIQEALDETLLITGNLFVLYDDVGKLTLKNVNSMKVPVLIDEEAAENYNYESGIDSQTFNKIKLAYENEETGKREIYIAQDGEKINQWGVLQYFETVKTEIGASEKAQSLLKLYDRKTRRLTIKNAFGDMRVKAGCAVAISLNLGDIVANTFMVVEKVTHTFKNDQHMMDVTVIGGDFVA